VQNKPVRAGALLFSDGGQFLPAAKGSISRRRFQMGTSSNGSRSPAGVDSDIEVLEKPKRRRFSVAEKSRIVREADACEAGTVGAYLRREGISSSQLYAWRRERDRGDLDRLGSLPRRKFART
jgi:transposase